MRRELTAACICVLAHAATGSAEVQSSEAKRACEVRLLLDGVLDAADGAHVHLAETSVEGLDLRFDPGSVAWGAFQETDAELDETDLEPSGADAALSASELAKKTQNPVADLISLPLQNNINFDVGTLGYAQNVLNIQPVIPISLDDDWNLITRTIVPVIYQPALFPGDDHDFGLGDVQFTAFFSPKEPVDGWILGAGPVVQLPTATDARLGARKWTAGPSVVALRMMGPWVVGGLVQNVWSFAGSGDSSVNTFLLQPFINYNLQDGWYLSAAPIITADWTADSSERWTVPVGGGLGRVFVAGSQPMNLQVQAFYNVEKPEFGADWSLRIQLQLLFPK